MGHPCKEGCLGFVGTVCLIDRSDQHGLSFFKLLLQRLKPLVQITNTSKLSPAYMNKILMSWNEKGLHTLAEIQEKDRPVRSRSAAGAEPRPAESIGSLWDKVNRI